MHFRRVPLNRFRRCLSVNRGPHCINESLQPFVCDKKLKKLEKWIYGNLRAFPSSLLQLAALPAPRTDSSHESVDDNGQEHSLTKEQRDILELVCSDGRPCVFFTGQAGTGKTYLLQQIVARINELERDQGRDPSETIAVTSTTGISAHAIGGMTLHSWAGLSILADKHFSSPELLLQQFRLPKNTVFRKRWQSIKTIFIDECSMLQPELLDLMDFLGRRLRNRLAEPFGGIQIVLSGDFMQLPPIASEAFKTHLKNVESNLRLSLAKRLVDSRKQALWLRNDNVPTPANADLLSFDDRQAIERDIKLQMRKMSGNRFCFDAKVWRFIVDGSTNMKPHLSFDRKSKKPVVKKPMTSTTGGQKFIRELRTPFRQLSDPLFCQLLNLIRQAFDTSHVMFPVVDALMNHLSMNFEDRPFDPVFRRIESGELVSLQQLLEYIEGDNETGFFFNVTNDRDCEDVSINDSVFKSLADIANPELEPVRLFSHKKKADDQNFRRIHSLGDANGPMIKYDAVDFEKVPSSCLLNSSLLLRRNAQVMLLKNLKPSIGLVNGTVGLVDSFLTVPLQSLSLYARLSHAVEKYAFPQPASDGVFQVPVVRFPMHPRISTQLESLAESVDFNGDMIKFDWNRRSLSLPIIPHLETEPIIENKKGAPLDQGPQLRPLRLQIPLSLAWSYSIHKSQGQTLPKVEIDVADVFEYGQMYVGISRATSLSRLKITGYTALNERIWKLIRHERVADFYNKLSGEQNG